MISALELQTIKSKSRERQIAIITGIVGALASSSGIDQLRRLVSGVRRDGSTISNEQMVKLAAFAAWAADIGTVPDRMSRDEHLSYLSDVMGQFGLDKRDAIELSIIGDAIQKWFEKNLH